MPQPKILLAMTGSVATVLADKIIPALQDIGEVKVVMSEAALHFANPSQLNKRHAVQVFTDVHEWSFRSSNMLDSPQYGYGYDGPESAPGWWTYQSQGLWQKDQPILHIELRKWADVLVVAPLTANTLAKMANGICDNLVTSILRAWEPHLPVVIAPAMNTVMWESPFTNMHINTLRAIFPITIVDPVEKTLACGDVGKGGLANIADIATATDDALRWQFPIEFIWTRGIPVGHHPGAFGFQRKHDIHDGVDIYVPEFLERGDAPVRVKAVEPGTVIGIAHFTGPQVGMPWWNDTDVVLVHGKSGVVGYGEIRPKTGLVIGQRLRRGDEIGSVIEVLKHGRRREDIPGHSRAMLHLALYEPGHRDWNPWHPGADVDDHLDPTPLLLDSIGFPGRLPEFEGEL